MKAIGGENNCIFDFRTQNFRKVSIKVHSLDRKMIKAIEEIITREFEKISEQISVNLQNTGSLFGLLNYIRR